VLTAMVPRRGGRPAGNGRCARRSGVLLAGTWLLLALRIERRLGEAARGAGDQPAATPFLPLGAVAGKRALLELPTGFTILQTLCKWRHGDRPTMWSSPGWCQVPGGGTIRAGQSAANERDLLGTSERLRWESLVSNSPGLRPQPAWFQTVWSGLRCPRGVRRCPGRHRRRIAPRPVRRSTEVAWTRSGHGHTQRVVRGASPPSPRHAKGAP